MSSIPQIGEPLPAFELPAAIPENGSITERTMSNSDFLGQPFVLFFYPKDDTPGCTVEVCGFRDLHGEFKKIGVALVGCSRDGIGPHKKFIVAQALPYPLLADKSQTLLKDWGLIVNKTMYGKPVTGVSRDTLLIDADGIVRQIFQKVTPLGHAQEVLETARKLFHSND
jgi:peroxiredoxin Q/BCP